MPNKIERILSHPEYVLSVRMTEYFEPIKYNSDYVLWNENHSNQISEISDITYIIYKSLDYINVNDVNKEYIENIVNDMLNNTIDYIQILNLLDEEDFNPENTIIGEYLYNNILSNIPSFEEAQVIINSRVQKILNEILKIPKMDFNKFNGIAIDVIKNLFYVENLSHDIEISISTNVYSCLTLEYLLKKNTSVSYELKIDTSVSSQNIHYKLSEFTYNTLNEFANIIMFMNEDLFSVIKEFYDHESYFENSDDFEEYWKILEEIGLDKIYKYCGVTPENLLIDEIKENKFNNITEDIISLYMLFNNQY
ncbi:hypothetical protein ACTS94_11005 [Empedobacter falsenii]